MLPIVPLSRLLSKYLAAQLVADWLSPETQRKGAVSKRPRLGGFPRLPGSADPALLRGRGGLPRKREVVICRQLDLTHMRATGRR